MALPYVLTPLPVRVVAFPWPFSLPPTRDRNGGHLELVGAGRSLTSSLHGGDSAPWMFCSARRDRLAIRRLLPSQQVRVRLSLVDQADGQQLQGHGAAEE